MVESESERAKEVLENYFGKPKEKFSKAKMKINPGMKGNKKLN